MPNNHPAAILSQGAGYGVVVGIGTAFALLMITLTHLQNKHTRFSTHRSEEFNTASRSVKPGLIAAGIVSAWTWAATLLQSSTVAYQYGVAGPFWYAAGATVQIFVFSVLACKVKMNAPRCHTYLEIVYARYGREAHLVFMFFAFVTNILVGSQLLLGGSAVVTSLTGMNVYAAIFLIPTGVCAYVVLGGLRATFLCDYTHTVALMVIIMYFLFNVYTTSPLIGSPSAMYDLLQEAARQRPVSGNQDGSYMTLKSNYALIFGVIQLCSGSGTVFLDQAYWQRAIASRPTTAVKAYILGGIAWFAIPFGFATTLGLAALALTNNPRFPTYPNQPPPSDITAGLASAYAASTLLGTQGALALLIALFLAVTSCASAELIAVSSLLTFDVYKTYLNPAATPKRLILVSHVCICLFGVTMSLFACIWNVAGIDLGWLFLVMGLLIGGAVFPVAFTILWAKQSKTGAIAGAISGLVTGLSAWLVVAKVHFGEISVASTGQEYSTLAGNLAAILTGAVVTTVVSLVKPQNFDWAITRSINAKPLVDTMELEGEKRPPSDDVAAAAAGPVAINDESKEEKQSGVTTTPQHDTALTTASPKTTETTAKSSFSKKSEVSDEETEDPLDPEALADAQLEENPNNLRRAFLVACISSFVLTFIVDFLFPLPLFLTHYTFSKPFFTTWVIVSFIWVFVSTGISVVLPVWETRRFWGEILGKAVGR